MLSECQKAVEGLCCDTEVMWCDVVCYLVKSDSKLLLCRVLWVRHVIKLRRWDKKSFDIHLICFIGMK